MIKTAKIKNDKIKKRAYRPWARWDESRLLSFLATDNGCTAVTFQFVQI
nr:MAG TPA_asm: hypothetical protein [Caudoviricetes sp.]